MIHGYGGSVVRRIYAEDRFCGMGESRSTSAITNGPFSTGPTTSKVVGPKVSNGISEHSE